MSSVIRYESRVKRVKKMFVFVFLPFVSGLAGIFLSMSSLYGEAISLNEILSAPDKFDGKTVEVEGEVVGDYFQGKGGAWINVLDRGSNIGIFISDKSMLKKIKHRGSYKIRGDVVRIKGIFFKNCFLHREQDIHPQDIKVVRKGFVKEESPSLFKVKLAVVSFIICLTTALIYFIKLRYG
jgi:hypothetical protein